MNKQIIKHLVAFAMLAFLTVPAVAMAQPALDPGIDIITPEISLSNQDPRVIAARIINTAMLFLGIIAVGIVLMGGFKWMTAGGNEDQVGQAKKLMGAGVVGLVIVLASWGIASFILTRLITAVN